MLVLEVLAVLSLSCCCRYEQQLSKQLQVQQAKIDHLEATADEHRVVLQTETRHSGGNI